MTTTAGSPPSDGAPRRRPMRQFCSRLPGTGLPRIGPGLGSLLKVRFPARSSVGLSELQELPVKESRAMRFLSVALAALVVAGWTAGDGANAGGKHRKFAAGCQAPWSSCAGPGCYAPGCSGCSGCSGCFGPTCGFSSCSGGYGCACSQPLCSGPCSMPMTCGYPNSCSCASGCSWPTTCAAATPGCAWPGCHSGMSPVGDAFWPDVPVSAQGLATMPTVDYYRPQLPRQAIIPGVPAAEDIAW